MRLNQPAGARERRRVPRVMWATEIFTLSACVITLYTTYHHWAAPYDIKTDFRYGRIVVVTMGVMAICSAGVWLFRAARRSVILKASGAFLALLGAVLAAFAMGATLMAARPVIASDAYDAAATEFNTYFAELTEPKPQLTRVKDSCLRVLNEPSSEQEIRDALAACREIIVAAEREAEKIARLQEDGKEMFLRRGVGKHRADAYFAWKEPVTLQMLGWYDSTVEVATRFRTLESRLQSQLAAPSVSN